MSKSTLPGSAGATEKPQWPMISVVTPWRTLLSAFGLIGSVKSEWVLMSIKPGATASPAASMIFRAVPAMPRPIAAMRPPAMAKSSPAAAALPAPSNNIPPRMMTSYTAPDCRELAAPPSGRRQVDGARRLLQRRRDARKGRVELRAETLDHRDDGDRNARGNQPIFDCGSGAIVVEETPNQCPHIKPHSRTVVPGRHNAQLPIVESLTAPTCGRSRAQCPPL